MSDLATYTQLNTRKASILQVGGFRPAGDLFASNFGLKPLALPGEAWPRSGGEPMRFVCQLNVSVAPAVPESLSDIKLITFFVDRGMDNFSDENGDDWCLRAYKSLDGLVTLEAPKGTSNLKRGFECSWELREDHPNYDDPDLVVPEGFDNEDVELENLDRTKIGGYASSIQSEPWWGHREHPANPAYCLQINSEEKVALQWGDGGTLFIARGTAAGCEDQWFLDFQCF